MIQRVKLITDRISLSCLGKDFKIRVERDCLNPDNGRVFLQIIYEAPCSKTGKVDTWSGRKWYLSEFMTDDEIVKTCYAAFEAAVKHEVLEGFKVDGLIVFNPHVSFEQLLRVSHMETTRPKSNLSLRKRSIFSFIKRWI